MSTAIDEYLVYQQNAEAKYGKNTIVFYENGTFYEIYGVDNDTEKIGQPKRISELLNIAITRKNKKILENSRKNPLMVGVPTAHAEKHIKSLINSGLTIVFVEQITQPPNPDRKLTRVLSPTTYISDEYKTDNNYVLAIYLEIVRNREGKANLGVGMVAYDLTVGDGIFYQTCSQNGDFKVVFEEVFRFMESVGPKEIVINVENCGMIPFTDIQDYLELYRHQYYVRDLKKDYFKIVYQNAVLQKVFELKCTISPIEFLNMEFQQFSTMAMMLCIDFIYDHDERILRSLNIPKEWEEKKHLILNNNTLYQLNIIGDGSQQQELGNVRSLFDIINRTKTVMGKRALKNWLLNPVVNPAILEKKYAILDKVISGKLWVKYDKSLSIILDLERFFRKMSIGYLMPHEMSAFETSLDAIRCLIGFSDDDFKQEDNNWLDIFSVNIHQKFKDFYDLYFKTFDLQLMATFCLNDINQSFFKMGVVPELDAIQKKIEKERAFFKEEAEKLSKLLDDKKTKDAVKFDHNERDGYFLRTTAKRGEMLMKKVGEEYSSKMSGANICRITSKKLEEANVDLQKAEGNIRDNVREKFIKWCETTYLTFHEMFSQIVRFVGTIDMTMNLAKVCLENCYNRPTIIANEEKTSFVDIKGLRHPIIEKINQETLYVPNDVVINGDGILLYGLNGGGKSSLLKAVGLAVVLAQMGCYVPAEKMEYYPFKMLYTRIMGNDNIFRGLSSFALEMTELRAILQYANRNSLILGDEICRGTEIHSALSIVSATVKMLCEKRTNFLFATHLHKLHEIDIVRECDNLRHFYIDIQMENGKLVFGRKIFEGIGNKLYGLEVAEHIVENDQFLRLATKTRRQLVEKEDILGNGEQIVSDKKSVYNSKLYVDECAVCGRKTGQLDVHHINSQKFADCNDTIDYYHKNHLGNLVVLCLDHHQKVHNGGLEVRGWITTSEGRQLDWEEKTAKPKVKVHVRKHKDMLGITEETRNTVMTYRPLLKNLSLRVLKAKIEKDLEQSFTCAQVRKIFNEIY